MDISVNELKNKLDKGEPFIFIDVREPEEYQEYNLGAKLIPLGNVDSIPSEYAQHKDDEIVVHCRSGVRSGRTVEYLQSQGFTNARNLLGGVLAWQDTFGK